jgi:hypothetical protein
MAAKDERFFQFGEQKHAPARRVERGGKQSVVASRIGTGNGAAGKPTQPIRLKPFMAQARLQVGADAFVETNHAYAMLAAVLVMKSFRGMGRRAIMRTTLATRYSTGSPYTRA